MKLRHTSATSLLGLIIAVAVLAFLVVVLRDQSANEECGPLIRSLQGRDPVERGEAALELGTLRLRGVRATAAIRPLIERLDDADPNVRVAAAQSLHYFGREAEPALPVLARIMRTNRTDLRAPAIRLLGAIGSAEAGVILIEALTDPDAEHRLETVQVLESVGRGAAFLIPVLTERLSNDTDATIRQAILRLLVNIDPDRGRILQTKLLACRDISAGVRMAALELLRSPDPVLFLDVFREAVSDQDAEVRTEALRGLSEIGLSHSGAIPSLCDALKDPHTRDAAVKAIGRVANWSRPGDNAATRALALDAAIPALSGAMECDDPRSREVVASLLCQLISTSEIENPPGSPTLRTAADALRGRIRHSDQMLRRYVLMTLLNENPSELLTPVFGDLLDEETDPTLGSARTANRSTWKATIASLIARAQARDPLIRRQLLINLLPEDLVQSLVPMVCAALADENEDLRLQSMILISNLCSDQRFSPKSTSTWARCIVSALEIALTDCVPGIRGSAAITLAQLGPVAKDSEPALRAAIAKERESSVRAWIEAALRQLGGAASSQVEPR